MRIVVRPLFLLLPLIFSGTASAAPAVNSSKTPHQIIASLRDKMYVTGETAPSLNAFIAAENAAVAELRLYMVDGNAEGLLEKNNYVQTPLMAASFVGYSGIVGELLKSEDVRKSINEVNPKGMSAWVYSNFAYYQTAWSCNPTTLNSPFAWVPLFVTQLYYIQSPENPYRKTRRLLEAVGAKIDMLGAKQFWQDNCKLESDDTRARVQKSNDLLETVLTDGNEALTRFLLEQQAKSKQ